MFATWTLLPEPIFRSQGVETGDIAHPIYLLHGSLDHSTIYRRRVDENESFAQQAGDDGRAFCRVVPDLGHPTTKDKERLANPGS
jgi:hypothetical protein